VEGKIVLNAQQRAGNGGDKKGGPDFRSQARLF
jgi:hypothetical protein